MPHELERFALTESALILSSQPVKIEVVNKVSTWRKMGIVARVAGQQAGRSRTVNAVWSAVRTTARSFGHALHQLWLEVTGLIFLVMSLGFGGAAVKEYEKYHAGHIGPARAAIAACATLTFAWFGLSSFWRVRSRSQRP